MHVQACTWVIMLFTLYGDCTFDILASILGCYLGKENCQKLVSSGRKTEKKLKRRKEESSFIDEFIDLSTVLNIF